MSHSRKYNRFSVTFLDFLTADASRSGPPVCLFSRLSPVRTGRLCRFMQPSGWGHTVCLTGVLATRVALSKICATHGSLENMKHVRFCSRAELKRPVAARTDVHGAEPKTLDVRARPPRLVGCAGRASRASRRFAGAGSRLFAHADRADPAHETSLAHWLAGRSCVLHGHSESQVLLRVVSGTLVEERYLPETARAVSLRAANIGEGAGESFFPAVRSIDCTA